MMDTGSIVIRLPDASRFAMAIRPEKTFRLMKTALSRFYRSILATGGNGPFRFACKTGLPVEELTDGDCFPVPFRPAESRRETVAGRNGDVSFSFTLQTVDQAYLSND
ncbi:hypothetical protein [Oxalobacter paraformigenes]|uniref:Uncharacterized protein n=2 Tax=Oxalobacter paraformigenes TaxID=556268 RepID=C3X3G0_9BURK|nr:hypothetical protein [Oxalobacter paraformigenes]EEO27746.1 hypothetical protein OFAG_00899 [Oxalobacter paraformigenes]